MLRLHAEQQSYATTLLTCMELELPNVHLAAGVPCWVTSGRVEAYLIVVGGVAGGDLFKGADTGGCVIRVAVAPAEGEGQAWGRWRWLEITWSVVWWRRGGSV